MYLPSSMLMFKIYFVMAVTSLYVATGAYQSIVDSRDFLEEALEPMKAILRSSVINDFTLSIITDGEAQYSAFSEVTKNIDLCSGVGIFEVSPEVDLSSMLLRLQQMHGPSSNPHVIVASKKSDFLSSILETLFQEDIIAWPTRLLVMTEKEILNQDHLTNLLSKTNAMILVPVDSGQRTRWNVYAYIPYSHRPLEVAAWNSRKGLVHQTGYPMFPNKFRTFLDGAHLQIVAEVYPPHTMLIDKHEVGDGIPFRGPMIHFLDVLTSTMNFTFTLIRAPDGKFGFAFPNGSWSGMIGMLIREEMDFALGPFNIIYSRAQVVDYTTPIMIDYGRIMAKLGEAEINPWGFLLPLAPMVWLGLLLSLFVILVLAHFMSLLLADLQEKSQYSLVNYVRILLMQNSEIASVKQWSNSILIATWMIGILVMTESYSGNLRSLLIVRHVPQPYHTVKSVVDDPRVTVLWEEDGAYKQILFKINNGVFKELADASRQHDKIDFITISTFYDDLKTKVYAGDHVLMIEDMTQKIYLSRHFTETGSCSFYLSDEHYFPLMLVTLAQKHSPLIPVFSEKIVMLTESGLYSHWVQKEFLNSTACAHAPRKILSQTNLSLNNLWGIFAVLGSGYLCGFFILCLEMGVFAIEPFVKGN